MTRDDFIVNILRLLKTSTIPDHDKEMVRILIDAFEIHALEDIYNSLSKERNLLNQIEDKKKRIIFKYNLMIEKITK